MSDIHTISSDDTKPSFSGKMREIEIKLGMENLVIHKSLATDQYEERSVFD